DLHTDLIDEHDGRSVPADHGGELAKRLRHEARLQPDMVVSHLAFDLRARDERRDRIDDDQIDRAATDQCFRDFQGLLASVWLRDEQLLDLHAELLRVPDVERVLRVDESRAPALRLHLRDGVQRERRLSARFRSVDLDHAAARVPATAQREIEPERSAGDDGYGLRAAVVLAEPHDGALAELLLDRAYRRQDGLQLLGNLAHVPSAVTLGRAPGDSPFSTAARARWMAGSTGPSRPSMGRSRQRYCTASSTWCTSMRGTDSRSAMVRDSFRMRSCARADRCSRSIAAERARRPSGDTEHMSRKRRPRSCAFAYSPGIGRKRSRCNARARSTRSRTCALLSPAGAPASSTGLSACASTCRSSLSRMGPETRRRYRCFEGMPHWHLDSP